jgi:thiol-disulfide isomerase/thioredoxin
MRARGGYLLSFIVTVGIIGQPGHAQDQRNREQVLADLSANELPVADVPAMADPAYAKEFTAKLNAAKAKRSELIFELYRLDPHGPKTAAFLPERWKVLAQTGKADEALTEMGGYLSSGIDEEKKISISFLRAQLRIQFTAKDTPGRLSAIDEFVKTIPKDNREPMTAQLLYLAGRLADDPADKERLLSRVAAEYPDSPAAKVVRGQMRKRESVGSIVDLAFDDAITGKRIDLADYRGKVVVLDFWAAWCTDCAAEIPYMKKVRAEFKDKGVEFVGVSLDLPVADGGLKALRTSVSRNQIDWPQFYQGNGWDSEFSTKYGVNWIPTVFVIDQQGKIANIDASGKLEPILQGLLKRADDR